MLTLEHRGRKHAIRLPLVGEFQIENALVAAGLAIGTGSDPAAVFASLEHLEGAKGRLERVGERNGAPIFVDYAHKPDALAKALEALRPYARGSLAVVFGCGGDRDAGKRPLMGAIAAGIAELKQGDVLLIAGKGHESGQIVGDRVLPFSDHDTVTEVLKLSLIHI